MHGHETMVKKAEMTPVMLSDREQVLDDTVALMETRERFNLELSVSETVYEKYKPNKEDTA